MPPKNVKNNKIQRSMICSWLIEDDNVISGLSLIQYQKDQAYIVISHLKISVFNQDTTENINSYQEASNATWLIRGLFHEALLVSV